MNRKVDIDYLISFLEQFRGSLFKHIRDNPMRGHEGYDKQVRGKNGIAADDFCSMLIYGNYQNITAKGPDFEERYELKLTTCNANTGHLKGDVSICDINIEDWNESNFKKKIENIIILVGFAKPTINKIEDENGCLVDVLKLDPDMRDDFLSELSRNYKEQKIRYSKDITNGVRGLLKLDNKNLKLTAKAVQKFMVSCFEDSKLSEIIDVKQLPLKLEIKKEIYKRWLQIYQKPLDGETFQNRLQTTPGYRSVIGIPIRHETLKMGQNKTMPNGEIWRPVRNDDGIVEINIY